MGWDQLAAGVALPFDPAIEIPELHEVRLEVPMPPPITEVAAATRNAVIEVLASEIRSGMTVAVGAGSRGLSDRIELLRGTIDALRSLGAEPFVVPAMGSHGGGTAEGQQKMLHSLGLTEEALGAEIRSTMETVVVATTVDGMPIYLDKHAADADRILPVNRIKPHTCFTGPVESGCTKMAVVGFGKQPGAAQIHACGPEVMRDRLLAGIDALRRTGRLLGGVASVESTAGAVVAIAALRSDDVGGDRERTLTDHAKSLVPTLPFDDIDVLIVDKAGKDISGTAIDPNVTGRFWVNGMLDLERPRVATIVLAGLSEVTAGNVLGIGLVDFVPAALASRIDWQQTYLNAFTAGPSGVRRAKVPMVMPDLESCIKAAMQMCGRGFGEPKRVVRIESTLHLTRCWVSDALR